MYSPRNIKNDLLFSIYNENRSVFKLNDIAMLIGETNFVSLNKRLNYFVQKGKLLNPRKGIYAKQGYSMNELACLLYTPSYISLEYVLQQAGVVFQFNSQITAVSYLSRNIEIEGVTLAFRKIKNEVLIDLSGIVTAETGVSMATPERALLDTLYLSSHYYFDNLNSIDVNLIYRLLPIYQSKTLTKRVTKLFKDDRFKQA
ncbi:MAG: hypothetical protein Q7J05_02900 [Paludibacter sp.]|nr:hypothetical protein [Paludibacter sp.]